MKRGRPREVENPVRIDIRLSADDYDVLDRAARSKDISLPALIRQVLSAVINRKQSSTSA